MCLTFHVCISDVLFLHATVVSCELFGVQCDDLGHSVIVISNGKKA